VVPLQAVIGGLLVLSHLNPYVLILHFLVSFPLITAAAISASATVTCSGTVNPCAPGASRVDF